MIKQHTGICAINERKMQDTGRAHAEPNRHSESRRYSWESGERATAMVHRYRVLERRVFIEKELYRHLQNGPTEYSADFGQWLQVSKPPKAEKDHLKRSKDRYSVLTQGCEQRLFPPAMWSENLIIHGALVIALRRVLPQYWRIISQLSDLGQMVSPRPMVSSFVKRKHYNLSLRSLIKLKFTEQCLTHWTSIKMSCFFLKHVSTWINM